MVRLSTWSYYLSTKRKYSEMWIGPHIYRPTLRFLLSFIKFLHALLIVLLLLVLFFVFTFNQQFLLSFAPQPLHHIYVQTSVCKFLIVHNLCFGSFHVVLDKDAQESNFGKKCTPDCAWPFDIKNKDGFAKSPGDLWKLIEHGLVSTSSSIRCIKKLGSQHEYLYPLCILKTNSHTFLHQDSNP